MKAPKNFPGGGPQQDPAPQLETPNPKPKTAAKPLDSANHFEVVETQTGFAMMNPPMAREVISREKAISLAAWLVVMTKVDFAEFGRLVGEINKL